MERAGLLQRLVLSLAEDHEREMEHRTPESVHEEDLIVRYVAYLVRLGWRRNAFHLLVALGRLLFRYHTSEILDLDALVGQDPNIARDDDYVRARKAVLRREVSNRFGNRLSELRGPRGARDIDGKPAIPRTAALVDECLARLVPWETKCPLPERDPADFDPTRESLDELSFDGGDPDGEHAVEIRRIHALTHPRCCLWLTTVLELASPDDRLSIPAFAGIDGSAGPPRRPPRLDPSDLLALAAEHRQRRQSRRRTSLELLSAGNLATRIDGGELIPISDARGLRIPDGAERVDLVATGVTPEPSVLAVLLLSTVVEGRFISSVSGGDALWDLRRQDSGWRLDVRVIHRFWHRAWFWRRLPAGTGRTSRGWRPALAFGLLLAGLIAGVAYLSDRLPRSRPPVVRTQGAIESLRIEVSPEIAGARGLERRLEARIRATGRWRLASSGRTDLLVSVKPESSGGLRVRILRDAETLWEGLYRASELSAAGEELTEVIESLSGDGTLPSPRTMKPDQ